MQRRKKTNEEPTVDDYREIGNELFPHQAARMLLGGVPFEQLGGRRGCNGTAVSVRRRPLQRVGDRVADDGLDAGKGRSACPPRGLADSPRSSRNTPTRCWASPHDNGRNFVVLRNPHGNNPPVADSPGSEWAAGAALNEGHPVPLDARGVFAVGEERFNQCFFGVDGINLAEDPPGG